VAKQPALGPRDLVLCAGTVLQAPLVDRIEAAAAAGFSAISLWAEDYEMARASGLSDADIRARLADRGLCIGELDGVSRWLPSEGDEPNLFGHSDEEFYAIADAIGGRSINVLEIFGNVVPIDVAAAAFAGVCDRAKEHGLLVHLEFLPWSGIPNVTRAWDIVRMADRSNGGLMLDTWHHIRSGEGNDALRAIPGERIIALQLSDAPKEADGDPMDETLRRRRLPGQGDGDLAELVKLLDAIGCRAPVGIEVFSEELAKLSTAEAARQAAEATRAVLASARRDAEAREASR
jgi:sugar phosphate isomerase/epimerase